MKKYNVPLTAWANITVTVETDETDPEKILELAEQQVDVFLCHQCADSRNNSLEVGDVWSGVRTDGVPEVYELKD